MGVAPTQGYRRQSGPAGTAAMPNASPSAFGAEVGGAMREAGAALHQDDLKANELELRRRRDAEAARAGREQAELQGRLQAEADEMRVSRRNESGEALGHTATITQRFDEAAAPFLEGIENVQVREHFATRMAELRTRMTDQERGWEQGQRAGAQARNVEAAVRQRAANLATRPFSFAELDAAIAETNADLTLQDSIAPDVRDEARRQLTRSLALAAVDQAIEQNPRATLDLVQGGRFNAYGLTADDIARRVDVAQGEVRAVEAEARRVQAGEAAQFRADMEILDRRFRDGDPTITDAELETMQQRAARLNLGSEVYDAASYRVRRQILREFDGSPATTLRQALGTVDERIRAAGDAARPEDVIRRTQLETMLERRMRLEADDPARAARVALPPIDASEASVRNRHAVARRIEAETGTYRFYDPPELARLQELAASGPNGRLQVVNEVARLAAVDARAAFRTAQEIAPNDRVFRHAIRLGPNVRAMVLRGAEARRQMPQQMTRADGSTGSFDGITQLWFQANIAPQLALLGPEDANDVLEGARSYYAESARASGNLAATSIDAGTFGEAVSAMLGRTSSGGGTGFWNYGPRNALGRPQGVVLPTRMTQDRFDAVMTFLPIGRLGESWPGRSIPNGGPRWRDGTVPSVDDIRARFVPMMVDDGVYEFHNAAGALLTASGRPFRLDVYELAAHPPRRAAGRQPAMPARLRAFTAPANDPNLSAAANASNRQAAWERWSAEKAAWEERNRP